MLRARHLHQYTYQKKENAGKCREEHKVEECKEQRLKCYYCGDDHRVGNRSCPTQKREEGIRQIRYKEKVSYNITKQKYLRTNSKNAKSCANVSKERIFKRKEGQAEAKRFQVEVEKKAGIKRKRETPLASNEGKEEAPEKRQDGTREAQKRFSVEQAAEKSDESMETDG